MKTPNEQINESIEQFVEGIISLVTNPENVQIELTFFGLFVLFGTIACIISKVVCGFSIPDDEYINFEYEDDYKEIQ